MKVKIQKHIAKIGKSSTLHINELSAKLEGEGQSIYRFGFGQSPFPVPGNVVHTLKKYAEIKDYLPVEGLNSLREAVAKYYTVQEGLPVETSNVLIGPGSKELMFILQMVLDCKILIPSPSWVSYEPQSIILKKKYSFINTSYNSYWKIEPDKLLKECQNTSELKLLILNYPGNPTGLSYSSSEMKVIAKICRENNIIILSDEIYSRLHHKGNHKSIAKYYPEGTIITSGLSKWCGAGGWRLGMMILPKELQNIQSKIASVSSETFSCVSAPIQYAAITAFNNDKTIKNYVLHSRRILKVIGNYCFKTLSESGVKLHNPEGGFYLFPDFSDYRSLLHQRKLYTSNEFCDQLLKKTGVALLPGSVFGRPEDEFTARLAYVNFNGKELLDISNKISLKNELTIEDLKKAANSLINGIKLISSWLQ